MLTDSLPRCSLLDLQAAQALEGDSGTLALIRLDGSHKAASSNNLSPWIDSGLELLDGPAIQAWQVPTAVNHGGIGRFSTHLTAEFGIISTTLPDSDDPEAAAKALYSELLATSRQLGLPHFLRIWQYLPHITASWQDEDRYRAFCAGRRQALETRDWKDNALPAACLLGSDSNKIVLYALIAEHPGQQIENPRQQSAFHYPPQYGRKPPSFSRAMSATRGSSERLFVSGTSSITGHASRHSNTLDQLEETLKNLEALVTNWQGQAAGLAAICPMKVYLRHAEDLEAVRGALGTRLPADHPIAYLRADVCRPELNVEIEGLIQPQETRQ